MTDAAPSAGEAPSKVYRLMESDADAAVAIEQVVNAARREIHIFDSTPRTLRDRGFGSPSRIEALRTLLLADRAHGVRIVLHEITAIEAELPRLVGLLARFSGQIQIHRTIGQATRARDPMIISEDRHFWRRLDLDRRRSVVTLNDAAATQPLIERFDEIWEKSEPAKSGRLLGL